MRRELKYGMISIFDYFYLKNSKKESRHIAEVHSPLNSFGYWTLNKYYYYYYYYLEVLCKLILIIYRFTVSYEEEEEKDHTMLNLYYIFIPFLFVHFVLFSASTMCIYRDHCVYHYTSTELIPLYWILDFKSILLLCMNMML